MLDNLLNRQFKLALWNFILGFLPIIGLIIFIALPAVTYGWDDSYSTYNYGSGTFSQGGYTDIYNPTGFFIAVALWAVGGIAQFVIWIIGIITAVKINSMTGNSAILIVFAIIPMWFGLLIVSVLQRNRYRGISSVEAPKRKVSNARTAPAARTSSHEDKLKASFLDGVITSAEYEKKLKEHRSKK